MKKAYITPLAKVYNVALRTHFQTVSGPETIGIPTDDNPIDAGGAEIKDIFDSSDDDNIIW